MDTTTENDEAKVFEQLAAQALRKAEELADAQKKADVAVARQLLDLRSKSDTEYFVIGDNGGAFRGVFKPPTIELWKRWKSEMRGEQTKTVANQNLAVSCLAWPTADSLAAAVAKRPALYDVIGVVLQEKAGAGQDALVKA